MISTMQKYVLFSKENNLTLEDVKVLKVAWAVQEKQCISYFPHSLFFLAIQLIFELVL